MQLKQAITLLAILTALVAVTIAISFLVNGGQTATQFLGPIAGCITHGC
jgi:hypothetical protein